MRNVRLFVPVAVVCASVGLAGFHARGVHGAAHRGWLLVANQQDQSLSVIDPDAGQQVGKIHESDYTGHEVVASPDGRRAFVPIYGDSGVGKPGSDGHTMEIIDVANRKIVGTVDFGHGVRPHKPVYDAKSGLLYVTTELDQAVTAVDPKTLKVVGKIPTGQAESHMLVLSHDGSKGYTANVGPGTVSVLDMKARKTIAVVPVSGMVQRIAISNDDKWVFTADQKKPRLAVIDTATNKVNGWVDLPSIGYGTAPTLDGRWLLVVMTNPGRVAVVDLQALKVARVIDVPKDPTEILMDPNGKTAYVACGASAKVAAIDLTGWIVKASMDAEKGADGLAWASVR